MFVPALAVFTQIDIDRFLLFGLQVRLEEEFVPDTVFIKIVQLMKNDVAVLLRP
jgi:hypothetical protein